MVAQAVKNLPAMQETQVRSLEKEMAIHSSVLAWRMDRGAYRVQTVSVIRLYFVQRSHLAVQAAVSHIMMKN